MDFNEAATTFSTLPKTSKLSSVSWLGWCALKNKPRDFKTVGEVNIYRIESNTKILNLTITNIWSCFEREEI